LQRGRVGVGGRKKLNNEEDQNLFFSLDIVTNKNQGEMGVTHSTQGIKENYVRRLQSFVVETEGRRSL